MNIALIYIYSNLYRVCLFTIIVRYSVGQFVIQIVKVMNTALIYLFCVFMEFVYPLYYFVNQIAISLFSWPVR